MGWMQIDKYSIIRAQVDDNLEQGNQKDRIAPKCQLEIECDASDITTLSNIMKMPPLRILSFDIECAAQHGFPDP